MQHGKVSSLGPGTIRFLFLSPSSIVFSDFFYCFSVCSSFFPLYFYPFSVSRECNGTFKKSSSSFTTDTPKNSEAVYTLVNKSGCRFLLSLYSVHIHFISQPFISQWWGFGIYLMKVEILSNLNKQWIAKKCTEAQSVHLDPSAANLVKLQLNNLMEYSSSLNTKAFNKCMEKLSEIRFLPTLLWKLQPKLNPNQPCSPKTPKKTRTKQKNLKS